MPIESESRENFKTKKLPNGNSFPIQLNDNGVKFCAVLPVPLISAIYASVQPFNSKSATQVVVCSCLTYRIRKD